MRSENIWEAQAPRWEVRMCLRQAQAPCNRRFGGWACRSHCGWNFSAWFWSFYNTKFTEILWNDAVFEFPKEHQRCSIECTDFNAIEIMCLRQTQAPCNRRFGGWACRSHCVCGIFLGDEVMKLWGFFDAAFDRLRQRIIEELVAELVEATNSFLFLISSVRGVAVRR